MKLSQNKIMALYFFGVVIVFLTIFELCDHYFGADKTFLGIICLIPFILLWCIKTDYRNKENYKRKGKTLIPKKDKYRQNLIAKLMHLRLDWVVQSYINAYADEWDNVPNDVIECRQLMEEYISHTYDTNLIIELIENETNC